MKLINLSAGWQFKQRNSDAVLADDFNQADAWLPASVPGVVHLDLLAAERIPDPFVGLNEEQVQWIGRSDWLYRCAFDLSEADLSGSSISLCLDGLDTYATVWLNGEQILVSDNMFVPYRIAVASLLKVGHNDLRILFESALLRGQQLEAQNGRRGLWNGDASRLYVRKAQYHYGWDWGPVLLTAGPWRAIRLEVYEARIAYLHCPYEVSDDLTSVVLPISVQLENYEQLADAECQIALYAPTNELIAELTVAIHNDQAVFHAQMTITAPQLWWPTGYGAQPLYRLVTTLRGSQAILDHRELRLGVRRLRLVQHDLIAEAGTSFYFEVNNLPVFCGGANWIPADSFTPRISRERYRQWLQLAVDSHMTMLRVWGGGIYEDPAFYALCDEMGLLVWQDFLFACGIYPADEWFQQSVRAEVEANVRLLRHHPSIVIWSGNNEDYARAETENLYDPAFQGDFLNTPFPARAIYEHLLPEICQELDPTRPYWPGSPYGGARSSDPTIGDVHIWSIWHGGVPYQEYAQNAGRFVSEFGMQALPVMKTIQAFATPEEQYSQSRTLDFHNKDVGGPRRLAPYIVDNIRVAVELPDYIYATQFIQSEALGAAIRGWRRRWQGERREYVSGALVWQLNDCWPVTSWAIVDYYLRPKPAYYTMSREFAPIVVGLSQQSPEQAAIWGVNGTLTAIAADLELRVWSLDGSLVSEQSRSVVLHANQATAFDDFAYLRSATTVLQARLLKDGSVLARTTLWPEPFKYLSLADPEISVTRLNSGSISVSATRPAKGVWLECDGETAKWSDNMLDLVPDDPQIIEVSAVADTAIRVYWLGKEW